MYRFFNIVNIGFVDKGASKLPACKVGGPKKKSAASAIPPVLCAIAFGQGSMPGLLQSFSKFDGQ